MLSMPVLVFDILKLVEAVPGVAFMLLQIVVGGTDGAYLSFSFVIVLLILSESTRLGVVGVGIDG